MVPPTPRGVLASAGAHLAQRTGDISMHESCLRGKELCREPAMRCINVLQDALARDAALQKLKYGGSEPSCGAARFNVTLPQGPQNMKFCNRHQSSLAASSRGLFWNSRSAGAMEGGAADDLPESRGEPVHRFNMSTLRGWFMDIDAKQTGSIKQRELIVALRLHKGMQALFCAVKGLAYEDSSGLSAEEAAQARREEVSRIKRILDEIDTDGSGTMEWAEFVEFFRRAGLFLEYRTRQSLNQCSAFEPHEDKVPEAAPFEAATERRHFHKSQSICAADLAMELESMRAEGQAAPAEGVSVACAGL